MHDKPVLLIGETQGFAEQGGSVNFYHDVDGTIGFQINVTTTARQGLQVSAKLLKLANVVEETGASTNDVRMSP